MGRKRYDFIEEVHERANHNMNSYYWFNRVTPFTVAQWRANKYFAPLFFVIYTAMGISILLAFNEDALSQNKSFWIYLFDFSDSFTTARFVGLLLFTVYWVIMSIATVQSIIQRIYSGQLVSEPERKIEKKKKYPRRPKNYK